MSLMDLGSTQKKRQRNRKTQNSGVVVKGDVESGEKDFYGVLEEVVILEYDALEDRSSPRIVLFKCRWFDVYTDGGGIKRDKFGAIFINMTRRLQTNEPFALASQIEQVFYVSLHNQPQWRLVIKTSPRNYFDFPNVDENENNESLWETALVEVANVPNLQDWGDEETSQMRIDANSTFVDANVIQQLFQSGDKEEESDESDEEEDVVDTSEAESIGSLDRDLEEVESESDDDDDA